MARTEWLLTRPWLLVVLVALLIAMPVLVIGELSANDARQRIRATELDGLARVADRAAASLTDRIESIAQQVTIAATTPVSGKPTALLLAIEHGDTPALEAFVSDLGALLRPQVLRLILLDRNGRALVLEPGDRNRIAEDDSGHEYFAQLSAANPTYLSGTYLTQAAGGRGAPFGNSLTPAIAASARIADVSGRTSGVLVAEIDLHLLGLALTPLLSAADEIYLVDANGRLVLRATHAFTSDPEALRDLSGALVIAPAGHNAAIETVDPLNGEIRIAGVARLTTPDWRVLAVRSPTPLEAELEASLAQSRIARLALVLVLILGTAVFSSTAGRAIRQRRQLNESLQHNTRLLGELEATGAALASANRHKSEFLANMSHELRTPLNAIIGFADVLGQRMFGGLNERQSDYVQDIRASGQHLLSLINDILDLAKVEAGRMELAPSDFSLRDVLTSSVTIIRDRAASHRIAVDLKIDDNIDRIVADERKVRQIFLNLLSNAVKFTPDGGSINVRAEASKTDALVSVRDSGVGIGLEDQARIFEEFRQARDRSRDTEGTGLGLPLAKSFVELHGGRLWVVSEPGKGSTFTFSLPLTVSPSVREESAATSP